jgi:alpha-mannosidase
MCYQLEQHRLLQEQDDIARKNLGSVSAAGLKLEQCFLLNISYCPTSEAELPFGKSLIVVVYNPLGWTREEYIRFPVSSAALEVIDGAGNSIPSQLVPLPKSAYRLRKLYVDGDDASVANNSPPRFHLVFSAVVPPLGYTTFRIHKPSSSSTTTSHPCAFLSLCLFLSIHHISPKKHTGMVLCLWSCCMVF